jgi:hypothetical protein
MDQRVAERGSLWALANSCLRNPLLRVLIRICALHSGVLSQTGTDSDTESVHSFYSILSASR